MGLGATGNSLVAGGGSMGGVFGEGRGDPAAEITSLLQTPVYRVGEDRIAGTGKEQVLAAAKSGEGLRCALCWHTAEPLCLSL